MRDRVLCPSVWEVGEVKSDILSARQERVANLYNLYCFSGLLHLNRPSPAGPLLAIEAPPGEKKEEEEEAEDQMENNTALAVVEDHIFEHLPPKLNQGMVQRKRTFAVFVCCVVCIKGLLGCGS